MRLHAPASEITGRVHGIVTPIDDQTCLLEVGIDSYDMAAVAIGMLGVDFDVDSPDEFAEHVRTLSERFARRRQRQIRLIGFRRY